MPSSSRLEKIILVLLSLGLLFWSVAFIRNTSFIAIDGKRYFSLFDDAMISMRYAWDLSHGLGLVWDPGLRIEGYTNLLMTLIMSLVTWILDRSTAVLSIQVFGIGLMLAIAFVSTRIVNYFIQDLPPQRQATVRILTFIGACAYYPLLYWTLMGMETGLLTLLLLLGVLFLFQYSVHRSVISIMLMAICLGMAYLTRNDSIIFTILIAGYIVWRIAKGHFTRIDLSNLSHEIIAAGVYVLFVVGQLVFRYTYYREWLPNTYTLKLTGMSPLFRIDNGIGFITPFLSEIVILLVLVCMEVIFDINNRKLLLLALFISAVAYQVYVGGDPWNYWRIMSPVMPLLLILFILAADAITTSISTTLFYKAYFLRHPVIPVKAIPELFIVLIVMGGLYSINARFLPEMDFSVKPYQVDANRDNTNIALALDRVTTDKATVGVFWAGSIPYYSGRTAIDFLGKSDPYIAKLPPDLSGKIGWSGMKSVPGHNKYDLKYSIQRLLPTYIQGYQWGTQDLSQWVGANYIKTDVNGVNLLLLKNSPDVAWKNLNRP